ncbi:chymotrypsin-2-like [Colias croceus]|uniref:chymotrypsin-2-like n=1 Tax=Colias crocea TaxID=72248 RepID=UPI001E27EEAB|nr:chymotrypsin-2-like [Colias croceus]
MALPLHDTDLGQYFSSQDARIVNGIDAPDGSVPYMAALVHGLLIGSFQCGGSVITTRHILSAAHCFERLYQDGQLTPTLRVIVGTNYWNVGGQAYSIQRNITHPKHIYIRDPLNVTYDIGLLVTHSEIVLSERVQLVPLSLEHIGAGVTAKVAGWGRIYHQGPLSPNLQELTVTTLEDERCDRELRQASIDSDMALPDYKPETEFCTIHSFGYGVCNGDSGSALVTDSGHQIGIVSWGLPCARGAPDVFVRISGFKDWLRENLVL